VEDRHATLHKEAALSWAVHARTRRKGWDGAA